MGHEKMKGEEEILQDKTLFLRSLSTSITSGVENSTYSCLLGPFMIYITGLQFHEV